MTTTQGPKYMYERNIPKWRLWKLSEPEKYGRGLMGLLKVFCQSKFYYVQNVVYLIGTILLNRKKLDILVKFLIIKILI